jgi:hypothetical protein
MQHHETAQTVAEIATKAQYGGSFVAAFFSFINQYAAAIGAIIAIAGYITNLIFKKRAERFLLEERALRIQLMREGKLTISEDDE